MPKTYKERAYDAEKDYRAHVVADNSPYWPGVVKGFRVLLLKALSVPRDDVAQAWENLGTSLKVITKDVAGIVLIALCLVLMPLTYPLARYNHRRRLDHETAESEKSEQ